MRTRVYVDGQPAWSDNVPSIGRMQKWALGGPIVPNRPVKRSEPMTDAAVRQRIRREAAKEAER